MNEDNYDEVYESTRKYEELCFNIYRQLKVYKVDNPFIKGVGVTLSKFKRVTPKQLRAMIKTLDDLKYADQI